MRVDWHLLMPARSAGLLVGSDSTLGCAAVPYNCSILALMRLQHCAVKLLAVLHPPA